MEVSFTNSRASIHSARRADTDWASLTLPWRIRSIELEGYVVIPDLLSATQLDAIRGELSRLPTTAVDYSEHQRGCANVQWTDSPAAIRVIALTAMIEFLTALFGDELVCTSCAYAVSQPRHPGIAIHTDAQPYDSKIFGLAASAPCQVRVLYYLDDFTPDPFFAYDPQRLVGQFHSIDQVAHDDSGQRCGFRAFGASGRHVSPVTAWTTGDPAV